MIKMERNGRLITIGFASFSVSEANVVDASEKFGEVQNLKVKFEPTT
jgi:hypothetical protein